MVRLSQAFLQKKNYPSFWRQPVDHLSRRVYDADIIRLRPSVFVSLKALASARLL